MQNQTTQLPPEDIENVFKVARSLLPAALALVRDSRLDAAFAEDCLIQAAHLTLKRLAEVEGESARIDNLPGYLFTVYKHLVMAELRESRRLERVDDAELETMRSTPDLASELERKILIGEIIEYLDDQSRFIYDRLVLGYTYDEIAPAFSKAFGKHVKANALRSRFSKAVQKVADEISI